MGQNRLKHTKLILLGIYNFGSKYMFYVLHTVHSMAWIKVKKSGILLPQHQSTYPRGPKSVSILLSKSTSKCEHCETRFT